MIAYGAFALLRPWWLAALALVIILGARRSAKGAGLAAWERAVDPPLLAAMVRGGATAGGGSARGGSILLALALIALGLSGPAVRVQDAERFRNLDALMILVDLSSEAASEAYVRLAAGAAHRVLAAGAGRAAGLVLYAGDAYSAGPLTDDADATGASIFALDGETVPDPGARPERALALARRILRDAAIAQGDIVMISAGGGLDEAAFRAAGALAAEGHTVSALHVPPSHPAGGTQPVGGADEGSGALARLAAVGGGAAAEAAAPERVLAAVSSRAATRLGASSATSLVWRDYGRAFLLLAALPLLMAFRRNARAEDRAAEDPS